MSTPLWSLEDVSLGRGPRPRLADVSLTISAGVTAILGYSGAGKTSLLNLLVSFERPDAGRLTFSAPDDRRLPLFWVPPDGGLWPHWTVREHLMRVLPTGHEPAALLKRFDLEELASARPERLSQGERSRLTTARALASQASVLVMDEPLVHVDPARAGGYWEAIRDALSQTGSSLVVATHSPETALSLAKSVVCLQEGRLVWCGDVTLLYEHPPTRELAWFLGPANWIAPEEWSAFFADPPPGRAVCLRPERLAIEPAPTGRFSVVQERFTGSVSEVELRDDRTLQTRTWWHRPAAASLRAGDRVSLGVIPASRVGRVGPASTSVH